MKLSLFTNLFLSGLHVRAKHTLPAHNLELVKFVFMMGPFVPVSPLLTSSFLMLPALLSSWQIQLKTALMEESAMYITSA